MTKQPKLPHHYKNPEEVMEGFLKAVISLSQSAKEMICEMDKGPADIPPVLLWITLDGEMKTEALMITDEVIAPVAVQQALARAFAEHGKPRIAGLIVEAYARKDGTPEQSWERGQLERDFLSGKVDGITECVTAFLFDLHNNTRTACLFYKYDDKGMPVFDEISTEKEHTSGAIADVIERFIHFACDWT